MREIGALHHHYSYTQRKYEIANIEVISIVVQASTEIKESLYTLQGKHSSIFYLLICSP